MSKTFCKQIDKIFLLVFFCFIAFLGVSQRWEFKSTTKSFLQKFVPKNPKLFFSRFFSHVFGRFSAGEGGVPKHHKKPPIFFDPGSFLASDPRTHHGGPRFFFGGPLISIDITEHRAQSPAAVALWCYTTGSLLAAAGLAGGWWLWLCAMWSLQSTQGTEPAAVAVACGV
jgi:hypothetical protein